MLSSSVVVPISVTRQELTEIGIDPGRVWDQATARRASAVGLVGGREVAWAEESVRYELGFQDIERFVSRRIVVQEDE